MTKFHQKGNGSLTVLPLVRLVHVLSSRPVSLFELGFDLSRPDSSIRRDCRHEHLRPGCRIHKHSLEG